MATFQARINALIGTTASNTTNIDEYLKDGVIDVTSRVVALNPQYSEHFVRGSSASGSQGGLSAGSGKIIAVVREAGVDNDWRPCRKIPLALQSRVTDISSIHYASIYNPAFTQSEDGAVLVYPVPSDSADQYKIYYINDVPANTSDASLAYSHSDIKYFPEDKTYLVVIYAGIKYLNYLLALKNDNIVSDLSGPVLEGISNNLNLPSTPAFPVLSDTTISFTASVPTYVKPSLVLDAKPTISDLSITAIPPVAPVTVATSINFTTTPPTYTSPVLSPDFADADANWITTEEDPELSTAKVNVINSEIAKYQTDIQNQLNVFNKEMAEYQAEMQVAIQDAQLSQQDTGTDLQNHVNKIQEYTQKVAAEVSTHQQNMTKELQLYTTSTGNAIQKYQSDLQNNVNDFNKENAEYQAELQIALTQGQLTQGDDNKKVQDYSAKVQAYAQEVTAEIQRFKSELERVNSVNQNKIAKYQGDVQDFLNRVQRDQMDYTWMDTRLTKLREEYNSAFAIMAPSQQKGEG